MHRTLMCHILKIANIRSCVTYFVHIEAKKTYETELVEYAILIQYTLKSKGAIFGEKP